ncbi:MAG: FAD-dependent oxidoreductase [Gordonibacter sp.]
MKQGVHNENHLSFAPSRRNFLKGAGLAVAGSAVFGLAGCASKQGASSDASQVAWDDEYDVIVVGAGIAGLSAAVTVAREGKGETCLLIEKDAMPNGNSPFCAGYMLYADDADAALEYLKWLTGDCTPEPVLKAYADGLKENIEWSKSIGIKEEWMIIDAPGADKTYEYPESHLSGNIGMWHHDTKNPEAKHLHKALLDLAQESDTITYTTSCPLDSLVQDPATKEILGVYANKKYYRAKKGVVMCCGGFESNQEMLFDYTGVAGAFPYAGNANTGDGHKACAKIGADFWHMHAGASYWLSCRNRDNTKFISVVFSFTTKQYGITVGTNGRRFYQDYDGACLLYNQTSPESDLRANVGYRHGITQFGGEWTHLPLPSKAWFVFDAKGLVDGAFPADISTDPVADGWAYTAATLQDLAAQIDVPVEELQKTVETWNGFCDNGEDVAFFRPADTMQKILEPPFYAMRCAPALLNTDGGPVRSPKAEILDPDGVPIKGLYSAGEFGSVWGHKYNGAGNVAECTSFGRIAARSLIAE